MWAVLLDVRALGGDTATTDQNNANHDPNLEVLLPKRLGLGEAATTLTAGGLCGVLSWTVAFPMDVLKTQAQLLPAEALASERSLVAIGRSVVAKHGVRHLYYGLGTCLVRAFPVNAITFFVYKNTLDQLESW